ncbi:MAG: hypothetical protein IKP22_14520 [Clostridia bacterium]|nr:hypothetical protein [Clostridia bacterium]
MKKIFAILMALCMMFAACAAMADMETPVMSNMPGVVIEDEETTVEESAFRGEWVLDVAFAGTEYADPQTLAEKYDFNFMPYIIADGKVMQDLQQENGEFVTVEMPYVFEAGQLQGKDAAGRDFVFELLENGNVVMSVFFPGEGDTVTCLSVYMVHPAE